MTLSNWNSGPLADLTLLGGGSGSYRRHNCHAKDAGGSGGALWRGTDWLRPQASPRTAPRALGAERRGGERVPRLRGGAARAARWSRPSAGRRRLQRGNRVRWLGRLRGLAKLLSCELSGETAEAPLLKRSRLLQRMQFMPVP